MKQKVYISCTTRNIYQPKVVNTLRDFGFSVYNHREPVTSSESIWSEERIQGNIIAKFDFEAIQNCDIIIALFPFTAQLVREVCDYKDDGKKCFALCPQKFKVPDEFKRIPSFYSIQPLINFLLK